MSKRTQVSVRGPTYDRLKKAAQERGTTPGRLVDDLCEKFFAEQNLGDANGGAVLNADDVPSKISFNRENGRG